MKKNPLLTAGIAALALCTAGAAWADAPMSARAATQPATQDTAAEIRALRARLDQLEAQQKETERKQAEAARQQEQKAASESVLKDASRHDKLLDITGITAGYNEKSHRFFIQSDDGNFVWRPWLHFQVRYVTLWRQDFKANGDDQIDSGFELRRMKLGFDGNLFTPDFTYNLNWATSRANGTSNVTDSTGKKIGTVSNNLGGVPILEEAWFRYNFHQTPFYVRAGQIKDPLLHDQIVSSRYQVSNERSLIADIFANGDAFTEGATFIFDPKSWIRTEAGVNHGIRSANTNFFDYPTQNAYNYGVAGRAEFKLFGRWEDYGQMGAVEIKDPLLVFGVGADYSERGHAGQTVGVVDAQYALPTGFSFYGALVDRYTTHSFGIYTQSATGASIGTPDPAVVNHATNEYGIMGQIAYVFDNRIEPFGRYEYMRLQGTPAGSQNYVQVITGGVNFYFYGNRLKLTPEILYLPWGIPIDDGASDVYASPKGHAEILGQLQLQWLL